MFGISGQKVDLAVSSGRNAVTATQVLECLDAVELPQNNEYHECSWSSKAGLSDKDSPKVPGIKEDCRYEYDYTDDGDLIKVLLQNIHS